MVFAAHIVDKKDFKAKDFLTLTPYLQFGQKGVWDNEAEDETNVTLTNMKGFVLFERYYWDIVKMRIKLQNTISLPNKHPSPIWKQCTESITQFWL